MVNFEEWLRTSKKKKQILTEELFETLQSFSTKELLVLIYLKGKDIDESYDLKVALRKAKKFKEMMK